MESCANAREKWEGYGALTLLTREWSSETRSQEPFAQHFG